MSKKADKSNDPKPKKDKKDKKGKADASGGPSVAAHPRASHAVRRAKGWGGMAGFAVAAYLSYKAGVPTVEMGVRALIAGMVGYMLAWACAVTVWRQLVLAEMRAAVEHVAAPNRDMIPARADSAKRGAPGNEAAPAAAPES
jgi:hypothetical protein